MIDEQSLSEIMVLVLEGKESTVLTRLKDMGFTDDEAHDAICELSKHVDKIRKRAEREARLSNFLNSRFIQVFSFQLCIVAAGAICFFLFGWLYEFKGCYIPITINGYCVLKSVVLTIVGSAGLTAGATLLNSFTAYFR